MAWMYVRRSFSFLVFGGMWTRHVSHFTNYRSSPAWPLLQFTQDTRNVARIVIELARRGMPLRANTGINPHRRWPWMGKNGKILEEYVSPAVPAL